MSASNHINQKQLRNLIAGDFAPHGFDEYPIRVGQLVREDVTMFSDSDHYDTLRDDIAKNGIKTPLSIHKNRLVDGHHRAVIAQELGLPKIPVNKFE